jgi:hypothetical protein
MTCPTSKEKAARNRNVLLRYVKTISGLLAGDDLSRLSFECPYLSRPMGLGEASNYGLFEPQNKDLLEQIAALFRDRLGDRTGLKFTEWTAQARNSFYTRWDVIEAIWENYITPEYGTDLAVLDGGCGCARGIHGAKDGQVEVYHGYDVDPIAIAYARRSLQSDHNAVHLIHEANFTHAQLCPEGFDIFGFNVPFETSGAGHQGHTTFFRHAAPAIRPGGAIVSFTSRSFLDNHGAAANRARAELYRDFDLIGAFRCVGFCEGESYSTEAPGDLVILRKRRSGDPIGSAAWLESCKPETNWLKKHCPDLLRYSDAGIWLNRHFIDNPDAIVGGATGKVMSPGKGQAFAFVTATQFKPTSRLAEELGRRLREVRYQPQPTTTIVMSQKPQTVLEYTEAIHQQNTQILEMFDQIKSNTGTQEQVHDLEFRLSDAQEKLTKLQEEFSSMSNLLDEIAIAYKGEIGEEITDLVRRYQKSISADAPVDNTDEADDDEL